MRLTIKRNGAEYIDAAQACGYLKCNYRVLFRLASQKKVRTLAAGGKRIKRYFFNLKDVTGIAGGHGNEGT